MTSPSVPLLTRLRRHRGLWLLFVAVMLVKLASGSVCMADRGERDGYAGGASAVTASSMVAAAATAAGDDCLLGEGASCHCACAHNATLPVTVLIVLAAPVAPFLRSPVDAGRVPELTGSLLRPPIA